MNLNDVFSQTLRDGEFTIVAARRISGLDWRLLIESLDDELKREAESLFYFIDGYVEEVEEGFVDDENDPELFKRIEDLMKKL